MHCFAGSKPASLLALFLPKPYCSIPCRPTSPFLSRAGGPSWLQWGFGCVRSRAFKLREDCFASVPFLDVANHADDPACDFR